MDNTVLVALITGATSIASATITAMLTHKTTASPPETPISSLRESGPSWSRFSLVYGKALTIILAAVASCFAGYALFNVFGILPYGKIPGPYTQNTLLPGARIECISDNATLSFESGWHSPDLSGKVTRYRDGIDVGPANLSGAKVNQTLDMSSVFRVDNAWTLCRFVAKEERYCDGVAGISLLLWAERGDTVELTLRNRINESEKLAIEVKDAWAVYEVPFNRFKTVSSQGILEFDIAFSSAVHSSKNNSLKIGRIATYSD